MLLYGAENHRENLMSSPETRSLFRESGKGKEVMNKASEEARSHRRWPGDDWAPGLAVTRQLV